MADGPLSECPDSGAAMYRSTPFGTDADTSTHVQPVPASQADAVGQERRAPRLEGGSAASGSFSDGSPVTES